MVKDRECPGLNLDLNGIGHGIPTFCMRCKGGVETDGLDFRLLDFYGTQGIGCEGIEPALRGGDFPADDAAIDQLQFPGLTGTYGAY